MSDTKQRRNINEGVWYALISKSNLYKLNETLGSLTESDKLYLQQILAPYMEPPTKYRDFWHAYDERKLVGLNELQSKQGKYTGVLIASYLPRSTLSEYKTTQKIGLQIIAYAELAKTKNKEVRKIFEITPIIWDIVKIILTYVPECGRVGAVIDICDNPPTPKTVYKQKTKGFFR